MITLSEAGLLYIKRENGREYANLKWGEYEVQQEKHNFYVIVKDATVDITKAYIHACKEGRTINA